MRSYKETFDAEDLGLVRVETVSPFRTEDCSSLISGSVLSTPHFHTMMN
jgi:hypothetical protein